MGKKKKRIIIISIISVLVLGILIAVISFLKYMKGNEYSKIAWKALSGGQQESVIGRGSLSHVETIKQKDNYIIPDDLVMKIKYGYMAQDGINVCFKDGVPEIIARIKIALIDGVIVDDRLKDMNIYKVRINGISVDKVNKLSKKLSKNDPVVSDAGVDAILTTPELAGYSQGSENVKNKSINVVTFYYFKDFKFNKYIVYIDKEAGKTYVIDDKEPSSTVQMTIGAE